MDSLPAPTTNQNPGGGSQPQNIYDLEAEYSLSVNHVPQRVTLAATYELPFGMGRPLLNSSKTLDYLAGGWNLNLTAYWQTGFALAVSQANQNGITGAGVQRPNATGIAPKSPLAGRDRIDGWFNREAFSPAPRYTFGNLSRVIPYLGPGQHNWDISVFKTFGICERLKAQFRAEAMNAFNTPMFNTPNRNFSSGGFGQITSQRNFPRQIQLGFRIFF